MIKNSCYIGKGSFLFAMGLSLSIFSASAQQISKDELNYLTSSWSGERYADGRPKVADALVERAKKITIDEAWTVLNNEGYTNQYVSGWKTVNGTMVAGRAVTAALLPSRPDVLDAIKKRGHKEGRVGDTNVWPIEVLQTGDVLVVNSFGKIKDGPVIGDNLGSSIFSKTGTGVIIDGGARDLDGLSKIKGFNAFVRDFHPSYLHEMMLTGLNTPVSIGHAVVMPGDVVISGSEGVLFIPAHLAEHVISTSEFIASKDKFSRSVLLSGRFKAGDIDNQWKSEIRVAFLQWLKENPAEIQLDRKQLDKFLEKRTW